MSTDPDAPAPDGLTYAQAGVRIDAGDQVVEAARGAAARTARPGAAPDLGGFGGLFDLAAAGFRDPILVAGADGVGTKLAVAHAIGRHRGLGVDLVAMCVNDVLAQGAEPLFFLDYFATGRIEEDAAAAVLAGIADGCADAGCALIGGETAEMPGLYPAGAYDLAGFVVGAVERGAVLPRTADMAAGDVLIALASSGPHANGFSLIRAVAERAGLAWDDPAPWAPAQPLGAALLEPTRIYVRALLPLIRAGRIKGLAHVTGGGLIENPPRMTPDRLTPDVDYASWTPPPVFAWIAEAGGVAPAEMRRTFNLGVGMIAAVAPDEADAVLAALTAAGETAWACGRLTTGAAA